MSTTLSLAGQETPDDSVNMQQCGAYETRTQSLERKMVDDIKKNEAYKRVILQSQIWIDDEFKK